MTCQQQSSQDDCDLTSFPVDSSMGEDELSRNVCAENRRWLSTGDVTPALRARLERFTEPGPVPRHVLKRECASCGSCQICMEGSPDYLQTIVRQLVSDLPLEGVHRMAKYAYSVTYVPDPSAENLPVNYAVALSRHESLRRDFIKLLAATRQEFTKRLKDGVSKEYWNVIEGAELDKLRHPDGRGHFLPANYVLKDPQGGASTKAILVFNPSQAYNTTLLAPTNVENRIQDVLRKIQSLGIVATQDIQEAFFRLGLSPAAEKMLFLMDLTEDGQLTTDNTPGTRLVAVAKAVSIMGVSQLPLLLALVRGDLDLDTVLQFMILEMAYVDDLPTAVLPRELAALQHELFPALEPLSLVLCADITCCRPSQAAGGPTCWPMGFTTPPDELRATRHLLKGEFGRRITHILVLRGAKLALS